MAELLKHTVDPKHCRVVILAGGNSSEREISLKSGQGALEALTAAGFAVDVVDPADEIAFAQVKPYKYDIAFLCLHGKGGEDGTIQRVLEQRGMHYTGSGVKASELAIDKIKTKEVYARAWIKTPASVTLQATEQVTEEVLACVGYPMIIKAPKEGSTIGIYRARNFEEARAGIEEVRKIADEVLVEQFVTGDEFTVACIGNNTPRALPVIQIIPQSGFYDFEAKYAPGGSKHLCPAPIDEALTHTLMAQAQAAHEALGCWGMSRTDFIVDADGSAWALETNTIPGMTKTSLLPDAAAAAGISFDELCTYLIELAFEYQVCPAHWTPPQE